jgi:hypothetical protein
MSSHHMVIVVSDPPLRPALLILLRLIFHQIPMKKAVMVTALLHALSAPIAVGLSFPSLLSPESGVVVGVEKMFVTDKPGVGADMVGSHDPDAVANTRADCAQVVGLHW